MNRSGRIFIVLFTFFLLSASTSRAMDTSGVFYGAIVPDEDIASGANDKPKWMVLWELGRKLVREGELQDAVKVYSLLLVREKNIDEARWELARIRVSLGELDKAAVLLETILERSPDQIRALNGLASISKLNGHLDRAVSLYRHVTDTLDPENSISLMGLSQSLLALGKKKEAIPYLEKLAQDESDIQSRRDLAFSYYELGLYELGRPLSASLAAIENADLSYIILAARLHSLLDRKSQAAQYWNRVVAASPQDQEAHLWLSSYYEKKKQYKDALRHYLVLHSISPDEPKYLFSIARGYMAGNNMKEALAYLNEYLSHKPFDKKAIRELINIHVALGDEGETLASLDRYFEVESHPSTGQLKQAARLYDEVGRYHDAIPIYRKLLKKNPNDRQILATLANDLLAIGEDEGALIILSDLARISPENKEIYVAMAGLLAKLNRHNERIAILEAINLLDPEDDDVTLDLVMLYSRKGDFGKSFSLFSSVEDKGFESPALLEKRAAVFLLHGLAEHALRDYEELLRIDTERDDIRLKSIQITGSLGLNSALESHVEILISKIKRTPDGAGEQGGGLLHGALLTSLGVQEYIRIANSYRDAGRYETALAMYREAELESRDSENFCSLVCLEKAKLYQDQGMKFEAEQALRMALLQGDDRWRAMTHLVQLGLDGKNMGDAGLWLTLLRYVTSQENISPSLSRSLEMQRQFLEILWDIAGGKYQAAIRKIKSLQVSLAEHQSVWFETPITLYHTDIELLRSYMGLEEYDLALALCRDLIGSNRLRLLPQVFFYRVLTETGSEEEASAQFETLLRIAGRDLGQLLELASYFQEAGDLESLKKVLTVARQKEPASYRVMIDLAKVYVDLNDFAGIYSVLDQMKKDFPGNIQLEGIAALVYFQKGENEKGLESCEAVLAIQEYRADILLLKARILWRSRQQDQALEVFHDYLAVTAESLFRDSAAGEGIEVPADVEDTFWQKITRVPDSDNRYIDNVMSPSFVGSIENHDVSRLAVPFYALYQWQKLFSEELQARRALARDEYLGASHYFSQMLVKYPNDPILLFDLAETYSHLGRSEDEALLYSKLHMIDPTYPGLSAAEERNRLKLQPRLIGTYRFRKEEGWDGYKDIRESSVKTGYNRSLAPGQNVQVEMSHHRYTDAESEESLMSNRFYAFYRGNMFHRVDVKVGAGVDALENDEGDTGLFSLEMNSRITDKVKGTVSYYRDVVTDTLASLGRNIVADKVKGSLSFDLSQYFTTGGSYDMDTYSDGNEFHGYSLWASVIFMTEPALLRFTYMYDFQDAREGNQEDGPLLADGFSDLDHPYWSPKNYWENSFHIYWQQHILSDMLEKEVPSYYTVEYILDYDSTGHERQSLKGGFSVELTSHFILESALEFVSSDNYRTKDLSLTAVYRW